MYHQSGPHPGPPPICFNCSKEGHFVVDCPEPKRTGVGGPPLGSNAQGPNPSNGNYSGSPASQWTTGQIPGAPGGTVTHFPKPPPVVTRYVVPGQPPQYSNSPSSYGPSPTASYQHSGSVPLGPSYSPSQGSYPPTPYGGSAPPYPHNPSPQSHSAPLLNSHYGHGYLPPPHNQFSTNVAPQYNGSPAQSYGPPAASYQSPVRQYPPRSNSYGGAAPPQWNNTTPISTSSPFNPPSHQQPNQQRMNSSNQREYSETPIQQSKQQQIQQSGYGPCSDVQQQTPQTPTPGFKQNRPTETSQSSPVDESYFPKSVTNSAPSSRASTPYGRYGSISSGPGKEKAPSVSLKSSPASPTVNVSEPISLGDDAALKEAAKEATKKEVEEGEEGEYTEEDLLQEQFNWDFKKIFKEPTPTENVALSQPLSYTYTVTPVPLMDPKWAGSVSRYARKENLKEYLKPIRTQPQWDYLKEDPAFSDVKLEGPLIPLREIRAWIAQRHGVEAAPQLAEETVEEEVLEESVNPRKRAWSNEQEDIDNQIQLEASIERSIEQPSKRQKNDAAGDECNMVEISGTPAPGTPIIGTAGTPTFGVADDVWAPEPGEAASVPMDPTEALLASLGVSGAPKPVREQSNPTTTEDQYATPPFGAIPHSMSPQIQTPGNGTPHKNFLQNIPPQVSQGSPQGPLPNHSGHGNPQYNYPQQGSPPQSTPYGAPPQQNVTYGNLGAPVYNNQPPQSNSNYGPPQQYGASYDHSPPPHRQSSYGNNQYGPPQGPYPPQGQYGQPQNQYPPQPQYNGPLNDEYAHAQPHWNAPPQGQYNGPPQCGPPQGPYGPSQSQYGPPQNQYGLPQSQYVPPQGQYGAQPQGQWGPPPGQYNNGYPPSQGPPQYGNSTYPPQVNPQYVNVPQQGSPPYQQFNNQGGQPPRQDSGYASARGSYSNGSGRNGPTPNDFSHGGPQQAQQVNGNDQIAKPPSNEVNASPAANGPTQSKKEASMVEGNAEYEGAKVTEPESPLSPTSAEILGKLTQPSKPRKIIRVISGKNKDASRQADDSFAKKSKRPAPVVAEAYSRRW